MTDIAKLGFSVDTSGLKKGERAMQSYASTGKKVEASTSKNASSMSDSFKKMAASIGLVATALAGLGKIVAIAREFDVLNAQLITATGSAEGAAIAFGAIQDFAAKTPFDLAQVTDSFVKLKNLGLTPSERALSSYGNTASAMGKSLNQLIEAVADATTNEFERLKEFGIKSKQQGDNVAFTFRGITTTVKKEAAAIEGFLMALGENEFAGAMAERTKTLDGAISNLGDSWDKLFLNISNAGVGGLMEDSVRAAIDALESLNDFIESGQLAASIDLIGMKFAVLSDPVFDAVNEIIKLFEAGTDFWSDEISAFGTFFKDAFVDMPENVKAVIQLIGIEIASLVDFAAEFGSAFGQVLGVKFAQVAEESKIYGRAIAAAVNPFSDDEFDLDSELKRISDITLEMADEIFSTAEANVERIAQLRRDSIVGIIEERDASIDAANKQGEAIIKLGEVFAAMKKKRSESTKDILAGFGSDSAGGGSATNKQKKELEKLIKTVDKFGGAWTKAGSVIIDAFGGIADSMNDYMKQIESISKLEKEAARQKKLDHADILAITKIETALQDERAMAELGGIKSISNASAKLFDDKTAAAKSLAALNKIITVAEIALSVQKMFFSDAETGKVVINEGIKAGASAKSAIAAAFAAPFPVGFAAGAAMIGIMSSLLGSSFGGGGGGSPGMSAQEIQKAQGTGTVFGDPSAKSESITKSGERFESIQIDQLAELRKIKTSIDSSNLNISKFTNIAIQSGGSALSAISGQTIGEISTQLETFDFGDRLDVLGLNFQIDAINSIKKPIGDIFESIGDSVLEASTLLGFNVTREMIDAFQVNIGEIDFSGLTGEEIERELQAIFGSQADILTGSLIPSMEAYTQVGESLFDTLTRVALEQAVFNDQIEKIGFNLKDLGNVLQIDIAQSIIELTGGLEKFSDLTQSFFENFFTEEEQFLQLEKSLQDAFDALGIPMETTTQGFRDLIDTLDLTTEADQALLAALLEINPALAEYIAALEDVEATRIRLLEEQAQAERSAALEAFRMLEQAIGIEKERARTVLDAARVARDAELSRISDLRSDLNERNQLAQSNLSAAQGALNSAFNAEIRRINEASSARISSIQNSLNESIKARQESVSAQIAAINESSNAQIKAIKEVSDARLDSLNDEKSAIQTIVSDLTSLVSNINSSLGLDKNTNLLDALQAAILGDFSKARTLDFGALTNLDPSGFGSAEDFRIQQSVNRNRLSTIGGLASGQLSESELLLDVIESQIETVKSQSDLQIEQLKLSTSSQIDSIKKSSDNQIEQMRLNANSQIDSIKRASESQIESLQNQLNALMGLDSSTLSISSAITNFETAKAQVAAINFDAEMAILDMMVDSANEVFALHEQGYRDEIARLDGILLDNKLLLNAALGIDESIISVADAIQSLADALLVVTGGPVRPTTPTPPTIPEPPTDEPIPDLPPLPPMPPPMDLPPLPPGGPRDTIVLELKQLRTQNEKFMEILVRNSTTSAKALKQFKNEGIETI